jgi:hypothetical protein
VLPEGIFEYMDGAGELYLGYRFECLDVADYETPEGPRILAELYRMATPDDAYGLLSTDWGGEHVELTAAPAPRWPPHALYGAGLLRLVCGNVYARIMADRETDASRRAVLDLGRAVATGSPAVVVPAMVGALPAALPGDLTLRRERCVYFRSHLVLNSIYFVSHANILSLGSTVEAVAGRYERGPGSGQPGVLLVAVRYESPVAAAAAQRSFFAAYLHDGGSPGGDPADGGVRAAWVEDGWVACVRRSDVVILAFQGVDEAGARSAVSDVAAGVAAREVDHE